jgi:transposase-like protein
LSKYSEEFKESVVRKMMPPESRSIAELSRETGVSEVTLYKWRDETRRGGRATPAGNSEPEKWSSEDKFLIVAETLTMSETELSEYCRKKGLYPEQVKEWKEVCVSANEDITRQTRDLKKEINREKKKGKKLERELKRKEKALAEAAALLVLQKKAQEIWGDREED